MLSLKSAVGCIIGSPCGLDDFQHLCDLHFLSGNSKETVSSHKAVLVAISCFFHDILTDIIHEDTASVILPDFNFRTLSMLVQFLHKGEVICSRSEYDQLIELLIILCINHENDAISHKQSQVDLVSFNSSATKGFSTEETLPVVDCNACDSDSESADFMVDDCNFSFTDTDQDNVKCDDRKEPDDEHTVDDPCNQPRLTQHRNNIEVEQFVCDICKEKFDEKSDLISHCAARHPDDNSGRKTEANDDQIGSVVKVQNISDQEDCKRDVLTNHTNKNSKARSTEKLQCDVCAKSFRYGANLKKHKKDCGVKPVKVKEVKQEKVRPKDETVFDQERGMFFCSLCSETFVWRALLDDHVREHHGEERRPHLCSICNKSFRHIQGLKSHMLIHNGAKDYKCSFCPKVFYTMSVKRAHEQIHDPNRPRPHVCEQCGLTFSYMCSYKSHIKRHDGVKNFKCSVCQDAFYGVRQLRQHELVHDPDRPRPYACKFCPKAFSYSLSLKKHLMVHSGEKDKQCSVCHKMFRGLSNLKRHEQSHDPNPPRPFVCEICDKAFMCKGALNEHSSIHTGEKPYMCDMCSKCFRTLANLCKHKQVHLNIRRFVCQTCNKDFRAAYDLKIHMKVHR